MKETLHTMFFILSAVAFTALWTALLLTRYRITRRIANHSLFSLYCKLTPTCTFDFKHPADGGKDAHADYVPHLQLLLHRIGHRYVHPPPPNRDFLEAFHEWLHFTLGPVSTWNAKKLDALEDASSAVLERAYPYADTEVKILMGKLTAMVIVIDDSVEDNEMYDHIARFAHRIYLGEAQPPGILTLYHESMMELSNLHEGDAVLRGLAVVPWINFADACLLEKRLLTEDPALRASPLDMGYNRLLRDRHNASLSSRSPSLHGGQNPNGNTKRGGDDNTQLAPLKGEALKFPHYLRYKTGLGEAYAAAIFKANKGQELPLTRYIKALPDMSFFIEVMNDLLSFHKEELAGETSNLVHLRTQALRSSPPYNGSGPAGVWTVSDTIRLLCDEVRDATHRIDALLQLEENEMRDRHKQGMEDVEDDVDIAIAKQWRGFRDGYISWHLESQRYKLDFLRPQEFHQCE